MIGEREWPTGNPVIPVRRVSSSISPTRKTLVASSRVSCPGADSIPPRRQTKVAHDPQERARMRLGIPGAPMAKAMRGIFAPSTRFRRLRISSTSAGSFAVVTILTAATPATADILL